MYRKIQAFTIIDLVVALIISSLIIGMAYFALSLFNNQFLRYLKKTTSLNDFFLFEKTWVRDWEQARYIRSKDNATFVMDYKNRASITYRMQDQWLIRTTGISRDTLPIQIQKSTVHLYNEKMNVVDQVEWVIFVGGEKIPCVYHKQYAAKDLLQLKNE